jgi:hypothetical protein
MDAFPECMKRRGGPEVEGLHGEYQMNGQRCHRIAGHDGNRLFDREPEFDPIREEARPLPVRQRFGIGTPVVVWPAPVPDVR